MVISQSPYSSSLDMSEEAESPDLMVAEPHSRALQSAARALQEYKNVSNIRPNQIEFLNLDRDCTLNHKKREVIDRMMSTITNPSVECVFDTDDLMIAFDLITRALITRVIAKDYNEISNFRNNIQNVFRRAIHMKMHNIMQYMMLVDVSEEEHLEFESDSIVLIQNYVADLFGTFDVFCGLSVPICDEREYLYLLKKNSDLSDVTKSADVDDVDGVDDAGDVSDSYAPLIEIYRHSKSDCCGCNFTNTMSRRSVCNLPAELVYSNLTSLFVNDEDMTQLKLIELVVGKSDLSDSHNQNLNSLLPEHLRGPTRRTKTTIRSRERGRYQQSKDRQNNRGKYGRRLYPPHLQPGTVNGMPTMVSGVSTPDQKRVPEGAPRGRRKLTADTNMSWRRPKGVK